MPKKKAPSERACSRLARHERQAIERMPDRGKGRREVAREMGRAPSTVADEVIPSMYFSPIAQTDRRRVRKCI
ncbi:MAG: helix-turn-helix domain-containing protein, partial [Collinsella stercoris]|nr:helix-turn-helix domain-containing protein [Collinsella stercoris]